MSGSRSLPPLDLSQPWLAPYVGSAVKCVSALAQGANVATVLNRINGTSVRFVSGQELPPEETYEVFIDATCSVPTRDNLHDLFNGLVWLAFPLSKRRLNALQADAIRAGGMSATRGPLRDAITVFDENGALLQAPEPLLDALAARDWRRLFIELRPLWQHARLVLFGHALLEKLVRPRKGICAHVLPLPIEGAPDRLDAALANRLCARTLAAKPFLPLPVLGVPGWWTENDLPAFYDDAAVFRPRRQPA